MQEEPAPEGATERSKRPMVDSPPEPRADLVHQRLLDAALRCAGELGYRNFAVRHVVAAAQTSRATFYAHFADKADCFAQAHAAATEVFAARIFAAAGAAPDWRQGVRAGLAELLDLVSADPSIARALLIESQAAGQGLRGQCEGSTDRFAAALDAARGEPLPHRPPRAGAFVVGGISSILVALLRSGETEGLADLLPGLVQFALLPYFGEQIAWEELSSASVLAGRQAE